MLAKLAPVLLTALVTVGAGVFTFGRDLVKRKAQVAGLHHVPRRS